MPAQPADVRHLLWLSLALAACGSNGPTHSNDGRLVACSPFSGIDKPITLGTVLGAGRSAAGDVYAADHVDTGDRVFKSADTRLIRLPLAGTGTGPGVYDFSITNYNPPFTLQIDVGPSGPTAMGILPGALDTKTFTIGQQGEALELVPASALTAFTLQNLSPVVFLEYNAQATDGRFLVVVRPKDEWTYEDFRVFFGPSDRVAQRQVAGVSRARDGGSTNITFDVDGASAVATFPVVADAQGFAPGPATLTIGADMQALMRLPTDAQPNNHAYLCAQP